MLQNERPQIIAIGGSGFLTEPQTLALERYVLSHARSPEPAVCFIPTANGDSDASLVRFYKDWCPLPIGDSRASGRLLESSMFLAASVIYEP